jgi:hypothetical protein
MEEKMKFLFLILFIFASFLYAQSHERECDFRWKYFDYNNFEEIESTKNNPSPSSQQAYEGSLYFVKNCEDWVNSKGSSELERFKKVKKLFEPILAQEREQKRKQATQDSIKQKSANEILALIKNNSEIDLILGKCKEYASTYTALKECKSIQDSVATQQDIIEITALLKANKLEECLDKCNKYKQKTDEKIADLCEKQLVGKVKKLPKNKIKSKELAKVYYHPDYEWIAAKMFHNYGKIALAETMGYNKTITVQISESIGCDFKNNDYIIGYGKYLGMKSLTVQGSVPHYQLFWCGEEQD